MLAADLGEGGNLLIGQEAHFEDQLAVRLGLAAHVGKGLDLVVDQGQVAVFQGTNVDDHVAGGAAQVQHLLQL